MPCRGQDKRSFLCPIQDGPFTDLLDFYFMGGITDDGPGVRDPKAVPKLKCKEIAIWFDSDFVALDAYCAWKVTGDLWMQPGLCREFRRAWCRYYARLTPPEVRPPRWFKGFSRWTGASLEYQRQHGVLINRSV